MVEPHVAVRGVGLFQGVDDDVDGVGASVAVGVVGGNAVSCADVVEDGEIGARRPAGEEVAVHGFAVTAVVSGFLRLQNPVPDLFRHLRGRALFHPVLGLLGCLVQVAQDIGDVETEVQTGFLVRLVLVR